MGSELVMRQRQDGTDETLGRLSQALSTLEERIAKARDQHSQERTQPSYPPQKNSSVQQGTQSALRDELQHIRAEMERELRNNMAAEAQATENQFRSVYETRANQAHISAATLELRSEIAALKDNVARMAREETLQSMINRFDKVERDIANLPHTVGSRDDLVQIAERIEDLQGTISKLPSTKGLDGLENRVTLLANAVERIATNNETESFPLESIQARFDELSRAVGAIPTSQQIMAGADNTDALDRIEARVAAVAAKMDKHVDLHGALPENAIIDLTARVEELSSKITDQGSNQGADVQFLDDMSNRLSYIVQQLNNSQATSEEHAHRLLSSLDGKMDEIARRIEENERQSTSIPSMEVMEQRLEEIAQLLSRDANNTSAPHSLENLERQVATLTEALSGSAASYDQETVLQAARAAAEEAVARLGSAGHGAESEEVGRLAEDLKLLENLARDSDDRNARTFEAIHDTLLKVVDHLSGLENTIISNAQMNHSTSSNAMASQAQHAMAQEEYHPRMEIADAPPMAPEDDVPIHPQHNIDHSNHERDRAGTLLSPAEAAAAAAVAAVKREESTQGISTERFAPTVEPEKPRSKSLLGSMANRLRQAASKTDTTTEAEGYNSGLVTDETKLDASANYGSGPAGNDSGDLSAIMRRVREERSGGNPEASADPQAENTQDAGKSDFIAAARRAARAAAGDAEMSGIGQNTANASSNKSLGGMLAKKRKPILLGAGAILLALLSLPILRGYLMPTEQVQQASIEKTQSIEPEVLPADPIDQIEETQEEVAQDEAVQDDVEKAVREIDLASSPQAMPEELDAAEEPTKEIAAEINIDLADIPEGVGSTVLREAAANGDAKAIYIVGDYFSGGIPGESENDLAKAFDWYKMSAEKGYAPAQYRVGNFFEKGFGVERDFESAKTWYQMAAEQGNASAMHNLAVLFASGASGEPDFTSATRWFEKAAELGVKDSQFNLGILSAKGEGMPQNLSESYKWFALAAIAGDLDAASKRDEVEKSLTPEQLNVAKDTVALWKAKPLIDEANIVTIPDQWRTDQAQTAAAPELSPEEMKKAIRNIQAILNNSGYDAGPADGIMGGKTKQAIMNFQKESNMTPDGEVSEQLVRKLLEVHQSATEG